MSSEEVILRGLGRELRGTAQGVLILRVAGGVVLGYREHRPGRHTLGEQLYRLVEVFSPP